MDGYINWAFLTICSEYDNHPTWTSIYGGVGTGRSISPASRLGVVVVAGAFLICVLKVEPRLNVPAITEPASRLAVSNASVELSRQPRFTANSFHISISSAQGCRPLLKTPRQNFLVRASLQYPVSERLIRDVQKADAAPVGPNLWTGEPTFRQGTFGV